jgi:phosphoglycerate dehydrogenase-like enzyme
MQQTIQQPNMTILSARGPLTFSASQREFMQGVAHVRYFECSEAWDAGAIGHYAPETQILGVTRRATKNLNMEWLGNLPQLKHISIYSSGYEWVDIAGLQNHGINVNYLPDYSTQSVAEHALGMLLTLSRRLHISHDIAQGHLPDTISMRGFELAGKSVGIIGCGRIGYAIASLCAAFGMRVRVHDALPRPRPWRNVTLDELLATSNIVFLAAPTQRNGKPILGNRELNNLPANAYIVNPSRPSLVDNDAMLQNIENKRLAGYAVDDAVFSAAQLKRVEAGRIFQTLHTGWYSNEAIERGTDDWVQHLVASALGEPIDVIAEREHV